LSQRIQRLLSRLVSIMAAGGKCSWTVWLTWWAILVGLGAGVLTLITLAGGIDRETAVSQVVLLAGLSLLIRTIDWLVWRATRLRHRSRDAEATGDE
jgi:fatty acid desaturase